MTAPPSARGFLVTFKPCGDVQHVERAPELGLWVTHIHNRRTRSGCQTSGRVVKVEPCPGCPDCPGWVAPVTSWRQPALFELGRAA